jgi:hypothetical protein
VILKSFNQLPFNRAKRSGGVIDRLGHVKVRGLSHYVFDLQSAFLGLLQREEALSGEIPNLK